jgi:hypothetical protein
MTVERDPELQALLDKQAIREVVLRYCRGVDRHDRDLVRDCYWPDAVDEHGSFTGTRDEYLTWLFDRMLTRYSMTMHFVGNILVEVEGARATSEAYGVSWHRGLADHAAPERGGDDLMSAFRYVDQMERRDLGGSGGVWRIARRTPPRRARPHRPRVLAVGPALPLAARLNNGSVRLRCRRG